MTTKTKRKQKTRVQSHRTLVRIQKRVEKILGKRKTAKQKGYL